MKKANNKFHASFPIMVGVTFLILCSYGIFASSIYVFKFDMRYILGIALSTFFAFVLPSTMWFSRIFSIVEFNEEGVKRANFKFLCKRKIQWNEVVEIRYYRFPGWIIISKSPLGYKDFSFVVERRDVIPIMYSKEVVQAIHRYTDIIINGIDDVENN